MYIRLILTFFRFLKRQKNKQKQTFIRNAKYMVLIFFCSFSLKLAIFSIFYSMCCLRFNLECDKLKTKKVQFLSLSINQINRIKLQNITYPSAWAWKRTTLMLVWTGINSNTSQFTQIWYQHHILLSSNRFTKRYFKIYIHVIISKQSPFTIHQKRKEETIKNQIWKQVLKPLVECSAIPPDLTG